MSLPSIGYTIRSFDSTTGEIYVEFAGGPTFPIPLPIKDGLYPEGDELDALIKTYTPVAFYARVDQVTVVQNADSISALVVPVSTT
jgi:hypothetical protein